jgi:ribonuclease P protein component
VLAAEQRLRQAGEFSAAIRSGGRAGRGGVVIHLYPARTDGGARAGFVVPRAVGPAVTRNKVRRRLRHLLRERLTALPAGTDVVVRVLPAAAGASYQALGADLDAALAAAQRRHSRGADRRKAEVIGGGDRREYTR